VGVTAHLRPTEVSASGSSLVTLPSIDAQLGVRSRKRSFPSAALKAVSGRSKVQMF